MGIALEPKTRGQPTKTTNTARLLDLAEKNRKTEENRTKITNTTKYKNTIREKTPLMHLLHKLLGMPQASPISSSLVS